jgi:7-keto-8-aminopelargonate synthetase-like enzyme
MMSSAYPEPVQQVDRTYVLWRGRKFSYFAGCDYLRLASHPAVLNAAHKSLDKFGLNVSASRKTTGNHQLYRELESVTRQFFKAEAAVITSTGYFTNIIAAQGLRGTIDQVFIDNRAHGSLRDAATFLGCPVTEFFHRNPHDLQRKLRAKTRRNRVALLTDGMFSTDGAIAPLGEYREILGPDALIWVDDAHAGGIIGRHGRGTVELAGLGRGNILQTITFSKAFGTYGGAVLCDRSRAAEIVEKSGAVGGNTPTPLPLVSATIEAIQLCTGSLRDRLFKNIERFWKTSGGSAPAILSPIILICPERADALRRKLVAAGIYPPLIRYPGGPAKGYFRFAISSEHTPSQIESLAEAVAGFMSVARGL